MSGSESGVMASNRGEPFNNVGGLQKGPLTSQPVIQKMRLAFGGDGTAVYKPISAPSYHSPNGVGASGGGGVEVAATGADTGGINVNVGAGGGAEQQPVKKKRGRPRKYGPDGAMSLSLIPGAAASGGGFPSPPASAGGGASGGSAASPNSVKKSRGRPPGSSNKKHKLEAPAIAGSTGTRFTPHVITVKAGEDISSKIMAFLQHGAKAVCILSANGAISNVTLRQPATSGGTVTYEGRFEILSLSGSFLLSEVGGQRSRTGGLSVSLSGPDGRVLGGGVAGLLTAASPVQVVVGSFNTENGGGGRKEPKAANPMEPFFAPSKVGPGPGSGTIGGGSPAWGDGTPSGSSEGPGSPLEQTMGHNTGLQGLSGMPWK